MTRYNLAIVAILAAIGLGSYFYANQPAPLRQQGVALAVVNVPQLSPGEQDGEAVYQQYCAACHGLNAAGQDGVAPPLVHRIYEPGHHGDAAFKNAATNGVRAHHWPFGDMPPLASITELEVEKIITYVRALQRANGIE